MELFYFVLVLSGLFWLILFMANIYENCLVLSLNGKSNSLVIATVLLLALSFVLMVQSIVSFLKMERGHV